METKKCSKCGRMLPVTDFYKSNRYKDGLQYYCKECHKAEAQKSRDEKVQMRENNPLSNYTPRELAQELKRRGYKWDKMYFIQEVKYENI